MFIRKKYVMSVLTTMLITLATVVNSKSVTTLTQVQRYLTQFGYLTANSRNNDNILDENAWSKAIQDFQSFANLEVTGELDSKTMISFSLPRCGLRDRTDIGIYNRSKRYILQDSKWPITPVTYQILNYPRNLMEADVDAEFDKAFSLWSEHANLSFKLKRTGAANIRIKFARGEHGDGNPFDGVGGVLAHAFNPRQGGEVHFDDDETFTINSTEGENLLQVAVHEIGHALGLDHSNVRSAIMAPFYRGYEPDLKLDADDILGIQAIYGKNPAEPDNGVHPTDTDDSEVALSPHNDEFCTDPKVDTIFNSEGAIYAFRGNKYYKLIENSIADGYPKFIYEGWPGLSDNIDAALTFIDGKTYFFKGDMYWRYNGRQIDGNFPRSIRDDFKDIPDNLDAVMSRSGDDKIFFYKGRNFWCYDPVNWWYPQPRPISMFHGVPNNLDAAVQYGHDYTVFFKDEKFYQFNHNLFSVDEVGLTAKWFGC